MLTNFVNPNSSFEIEGTQKPEGIRLSIITAVRNDHRVTTAMRSVAQQEDVDTEHIIVDGSSDDGTVELIRNQGGPNVTLISEPDSGLYDAINKGIKRATGDVIGFLNADDQFSSTDVLSEISRTFEECNRDIVFGNVRYIDSDGNTKRRWLSCPFERGLFQKSWTPAHPTFYTYRSNYEKHGLYRTDFRIAADVELMYRFLEVHQLSSYYLPKELVVMSAGGISNRGIGSTMTIFREVKRGIIENGGSFNDVKYLFFKLLKAREFLVRK